MADEPVPYRTNGDRPVISITAEPSIAETNTGSISPLMAKMRASPYGPITPSPVLLGLKEIR
jgi:hypothetical protein